MVKGDRLEVGAAWETRWRRVCCFMGDERCIKALMKLITLYIYSYETKMRRSFFLLSFLLVSIMSQHIVPTMLLPMETTKDATTSYSIGLISDTTIPNFAFIRITFPYEFDPRELPNNPTCKMKKGSQDIQSITCTRNKN